MTGLVLCGGKSSRMGSDKGLLLRSGKPWSLIAREKLLAFCEEVYLSVQAGQAEIYGKIIQPRWLLPDDPRVKAYCAGPLAAILSVPARIPGADLLILACDMPDMDLEVLSELVTAYRQYPGYPCYAFGAGAYFEPLCAIYTSELLWMLSRAAHSGMGSLQQVLGQHQTFCLPFKPEKLPAFKNYNEPDQKTGLPSEG